MEIRRDTGIFLERIGETRPIDYSDLVTGDVAADRRRIDMLLHTISDVSGNVSVADVVESVLDKSLAVTGAERAILMLYDGEKVLRVVRARDSAGADLDVNLAHSHTVPRLVVRDGKGVCLTDAPKQSEELRLGDSIAHLQLLTVMGAPLRVRDRMLGLLYVDSKASAEGFGEQDLTLFEALANQMAVAIDNARLVDHYVDLQRKKAALSAARDVQRRLLPASAPRVPGLDICSLFEACDETSGDYFDYIRRGPGRLGLVVGDVSGHGFAAALIMSSACAQLRTLATTDASLAETVARTSAFLVESTRPEHFMTLFYGEVDLRERTLQYVRAGHCEPVLYRRNADAFEDLAEGGMALGMLEDSEYGAAGPVRLERGDLLLLYSDGLIEAMNGDDEQFGLEPAREILRAGRDLPSRDVVERIRSALGDFVGDEPLKDDLTIVLVKVS
jgi:sigma-B regulation protein RsbU (phosphoserine phosphatase)